MLILAFETTGRHASVACIDGTGLLFEETSEGLMNHLQSLMPMTESLLKKNGFTINDISNVTASSGPGSFTGIRIGVASARALAQALDIPCIRIPTLQSFIYNAKSRPELVCPVLDAKRGQIYGGVFYIDGVTGNICEPVKSGAYGVEEYLKLLNQVVTDRNILSVMFFGDGIEAYGDEIKKWRRSALPGSVGLEFAEEGIRYQKASSVARLALKYFYDGEQINYKDLFPLYLRKAEAERKLEAGFPQIER